MNGAQIAHCLKILGKGSEAAGVVAIFRDGILVGVGWTVAGGIFYHIGRWGYKKLMDALRENEMTAVSEEAA